MLTVINRHHYRDGLPPGSVYVGRGASVLGNPFTLEKHGSRALELYRDHLFGAIEKRDEVILAALNAIGPDAVLVSSCAPRPCHADIVVEAWEWLAGKGDW